jgi:hypothetical protein
MIEAKQTVARLRDGDSSMTSSLRTPPAAHPASQIVAGSRARFACAVAALAVILAGCAAESPTRGPPRPPAQVRAQLVDLLPTTLADREGWAADIQEAFARLAIPPSTENLCAVLAVTEQESTYVADPVVPGLAKIAREEIERRAGRLGVPSFVVRAALQLESGDGRTYAERLAAVRTEKQLSLLYEDLIARVPLGKQLFAGANPVRTGGPMQVGIAFAERHADERPYPYATDGSIRNEVFTRRGGMYFGIAHLLGYPANYDRHLYRYADFNAGWYASRNAAFQAAVATASGRRLALDGDLVVPDGSRVGDTEAAVRALGVQLGLGDAAIRRALEKGDSLDFERTGLYTEVFALAERKAGRTLPRAVVPTIDLQSPKFTRKLTTAWFADRVQQRYRRCVDKALSGS